MDFIPDWLVYVAGAIVAAGLFLMIVFWPHDDDEHDDIGGVR